MAEVTAMRNNATIFPVYGLPYTAVFPLLDADGDPVTGATCDSEVSLNGDTGADCTNEGVEITFTTATNKGQYYLILTAAEMTADIVTVSVYSATSKATVITLYPRKLAVLLTADNAGAYDSTTTINLGASAIAVDNYYIGCIVYIYGGIGNGQVRMITGYAGATKLATVHVAWATNPDATSDLKVYRTEQAPYVMGANVQQWLGTACATPAVAGRPSVDAIAISGDTTAADNLEAATDGGTYNVGGGAVVAASVTGAVGSVTGAVGSVTGAVGSVTGNVGGNVVGSVASVTGAVGSVTGAVGSVTGNVGGTVASVVGNVGGNVVGSVASVTGAVGSVTGAVGSVTGAVGSVTGNVGGNVVGSVASVTGAVGSVTGNVGGSVASVVGNVGGNVVGSVASVTGAVGSVTGNVGGSVASVAGNVIGSVGSVVGFTPAQVTNIYTAFELDGAVYRLTTNALELAPTGGSAPTTAQIVAAIKADGQWKAILGKARGREVWNDVAKTLTVYDTDDVTPLFVLTLSPTGRTVA